MNPTLRKGFSGNICYELVNPKQIYVFVKKKKKKNSSDHVKYKSTWVDVQDSQALHISQLAQVVHFHN